MSGDRMSKEQTDAERHQFRIWLASEALQYCSQRDLRAADAFEALFGAMAMVLVENRKPGLSREAALRLIEPPLRHAIEKAIALDHQDQTIGVVK
jgi:hypothetical protein